MEEYGGRIGWKNRFGRNSVRVEVFGNCTNKRFGTVHISGCHCDTGQNCCSVVQAPDSLILCCIPNNLLTTPTVSFSVAYSTTYLHLLAQKSPHKQPGIMRAQAATARALHTACRTNRPGVQCCQPRTTQETGGRGRRGQH